MNRFKAPPRIDVEHQAEDLHFDGLTLGQAKDLIADHISKYGATSFIREVAKPYDHYQLATHKLRPETDLEYSTRCKNLENKFLSDQARDLRELKRLQVKLGLKKGASS